MSNQIPDKPPILEPSIRQHRDRMAGLWAAELLGLIGRAAHDYAQGLAHSHAEAAGEAAGDDHIIRRLTHDLRDKVASHEIREKLSHLVHEARRQLQRGDKDGKH